MFSTLRGARNGGNRCFLGFVCCFAMHAPTPFRAGRAVYNPCLNVISFYCSIWSCVGSIFGPQHVLLTALTWHVMVRSPKAREMSTSCIPLASDFRQDIGKVEFEIMHKRHPADACMIFAGHVRM